MAHISPNTLGMSNSPEEIDNLPPGLRDCVHEFGWSVVRAYMEHGISKPNVIRHLIHTAWNGPREPGNKRGHERGGGNRAIQALDTYLLRADGVPHGRELVGLLRNSNIVLLPFEPTDKMVLASIDALSKRGTVTYENKHRIRLRAAMKAGVAEAWPFLKLP